MLPRWKQSLKCSQVRKYRVGQSRLTVVHTKNIIINDILEKQTYRDKKKNSGCQGLGKREELIIGAERIFRYVKLFCLTV